MSRLDTMKNRKKLKAAFAVIIMLAAGIGAAAIVDNDTTEESDANPAIIFALVVWSIAVAVSAFLAGYTIGHAGSGGDDASSRQLDAAVVAQAITTGTGDVTNSFDNLKQIWTLTDEHFIRFAELAASFQWKKDTQYSAENILTDSGAYQNAAIGIANSSVQTSYLFQQVGERLDYWNTQSFSQNKMELSWVYGGTNTFSSRTAFNGWLTSVATPDSTHNKVYISDVGTMFVMEGSATITSSDGTVVSLAQGPNDLTAGFTPGIYTLQTGRTYAGPMVYVIDPKASTMTSGIVMKAGSEYKLAKYNPNLDRVEIGSSQYTSLAIRVSPDGAAAPADVPIYVYLKSLWSMMLTVSQTLGNANSSANAVWNIFDSVGAASAYLTTLSVPNNYAGITLTTAQKEMMLRSAMLQLGKFIQAGQTQIEASDFQLSSASMGLFCRGDIYNSSGKLLYQDVIFTPLFYSKDTTLKNGSNITEQPAIIAIWASGTPLSSWNFTGSTEAGGVPPIGTGSNIYIYEMKNAGAFVSTVNLEVKKISFIDASDWDWVWVPPNPPGDTQWAVIVIIVGCIMTIIGIVVPLVRPLAYLGIVVAVIGVAWYALDSFSVWNLLVGRAGGDFIEIG